MDYHFCWNCKHYFEDNSVGVAECECENMPEEEYDKYCVRLAGEKCPYFDALQTDEQINEQIKAEEEMYEESLYLMGHIKSL